MLWLREKESSGFVNKLFSSPSNKKSGIPSIIKWVDGENGTILQVEPQSQEADSDESSPLPQSAGYMKTLSLTEIKTVECKNQTLTLYTQVGGNPKKLLQFTVIQHDELSPENVQQAIQFLLEWENNRIPEDERQVEMDMNRAQKAAHFCQRELEMKRMKSEREKRKQKYLNMSRKNGGGMKYTAIAMANRADNNIT